MQEWVNRTFDKVNEKLLWVQEKNREIIPYTTGADGSYIPFKQDHITWWTNGFWTGMMWLMYLDTKNEVYKITAERSEELLDEAFARYDSLNHDVGFMWYITSGVNYRLTGNKTSKNRVMTAASLLAARYNIKGEFIRAWNGDKHGWAIIDCMMNIPLLYFASKETGDPRFAYIAQSHADKTMKCHVRADGSVNHIVNYDIENGKLIETFGGQGYAVGSSWTRGQAWALYGFVLSYIHTKNQAYLDTAKRVAHYFISCVCDDYVPRCDFRSPEKPCYYDTTAGAIAACGLLEIVNCVPEVEKKVYKRAALNILKALEENHCDFSEKTHAILKDGTEAYHSDSGHNIPIIYGDYYFVEALYKLRGNEMLFW